MRLSWVQLRSTWVCGLGIREGCDTFRGRECVDWEIQFMVHGVGCGWF